MNDEKEISYIIETAPIVENMVEEFSAYNQIVSSLIWILFLLFLYFRFSPQAFIKNIRAELDKKIKHRKVLSYLWVFILALFIASFSSKPIYPMKYEEMPTFQGSFAWYQPAWKNRIASLYLRKDGRKFVFKLHYPSKEISEEIQNLNKGDTVSLRVHLKKDDFQVKSYVAEINMRGVKSYLLKSTYQARLERYENRNKYILFWLMFLVILTFCLFRKLPKANKTTE